MSWVLLGHGYSNWMGGIFVNNPQVSSRIFRQLRETNQQYVKGTQLTIVDKYETNQQIIIYLIAYLQVSSRNKQWRGNQAIIYVSMGPNWQLLRSQNKISNVFLLQYLYQYLEHGEFAAVTNALPSVDSFFLIGESCFTLYCPAQSCKMSILLHRAKPLN